MAQLIPLFPLAQVLLPAMPLPLHIFEQRYKEMMGEVIPARDEFGVVLAKEDGIVNIGCTARVHEVITKYPDGRLDLLAVGERRFRILSLDEDKSYLRAGVEFFADNDVSDVPPDLSEKVTDALRQLMRIEKVNAEDEPDLEYTQVSFRVAQFIEDLDKRQTVLSLRSEVERLQYLAKILPNYIEQREQNILAKRVAPLNGHAKYVVGL